MVHTSEQLDAIDDVESGDLGLERRPQWSVADDAQAQRDARPEACDRVDEHVEALLLDESADGEQFEHLTVGAAR